MGNCLFGGTAGGSSDPLVQVVTSNGGIMEFQPPIVAGCIIDEFTGHAMYRSDGDERLRMPMQLNEKLRSGETYYLLPTGSIGGHVRSKSAPTKAVPVPAAAPLYRMSSDDQSQSQKQLLMRSFSNSDNYYKDGGVWKVKLVISRQQLIEILSQEALTQEFVDTVRIVAKCGRHSALGSYADQWSVSSRSIASSD
ncbi:hypothetical protein Nepgr_011444 [Nepenthes gracilis]|uniref:Uncharacterized protein n=1 Tax=Nepenthes gracilis TaxID=150966 RepID=A0AAD3SE76_NEPGR|nr:hypothetical protein Nepgr_011444 [Nepenthes gracilis]